MCVSLLELFFLTLKPNQQKRFKNQKNIFCKCVSDLNFVPFNGSRFFIFLKKSNSVYPIEEKENVPEQKP
jgi:hypothetical protein